MVSSSFFSRFKALVIKQKTRSYYMYLRYFIRGAS